MWVALVVGCLLAGAAPVSAADPAAVTASKRVVVGYFANWSIYGRGYYPKDIPAGLYTHVNYAFARPTSDGKCASLDPWADWQRPFSAAESVAGVADVGGQTLKGNFNQLRQLKAAHPKLRLLMSIGGWTESEYFSNIALTADSRRKFVRSCLNLFIKGNLPYDGENSSGTGGPGVAKGIFDGIDIDWEYPARQGAGGNAVRPEDRTNVTLLFREFRRQMDAIGVKTGKHYLLTAAIPAGYTAGKSYELPKVADTLDWLNLMAYDLHGAWDATTNFNSPFRLDPADPNGSAALTVKGSVRYMLDHGVPPSRLVVGVPFYGVQWTGARANHHGLFQAYNSSPGNPSYHQLVDLSKLVTSPANGAAPVGRKGYTRYWNNAAGEPWLWKPSATGAGKTGSVITYDDPASLAKRVRLVKNLGLRGLMCWELSQDSDGRALGRTLAKVRKT
jgi:chitinase